MSNKSNCKHVERFKILRIMEILCIADCLGGLVFHPFVIAGLIICMAMAVLIPITISSDNFNIKSIMAGVGRLTVFGLPICLVAALYAEVGIALTVIFALSVFILPLYILLTVSIIRLAVIGKQSPSQLAVSVIGYFAALFVPSVLLINCYNCCTPSYFCYERDIYLMVFDLGYLILPYTLAAVVTFVIAPKLSSGKLMSIGWSTLIYGAFIVLWLFFPRVPMAITDGRNPYYFNLILGKNDFTERAVKWLIFAIVATITAWGVSFVCCMVKRFRDNGFTKNEVNNSD